ncbi:GntR family transcriptional regulator [Streptomyces sp. NPDC047981]|uniref:GntR family transcriptional regulator n=1 Tax=Streptomyces sp. NPDC047981 TaxID=3154610 RepID=UPI00342EF787
MNGTRWSGRIPAVKSKADLVHESLRTAIARGDLAPGARINMDELARNYGVSKIPVREAVKRLESEGLVVSRVHSGVTVAEVDLHEMRGVSLAREAIEGLVCRLASKNVDPGLLIELERIQVAMRAALADRAIGALPELNTRFHHALAAASGYRILAELTGQLVLTIRRYRITAPMDEANWRAVVEEHDAIVGALRSGDEAAAVRAARAHAAPQSEYEAVAAE